MPPKPRKPASTSKVSTEKKRKTATSRKDKLNVSFDEFSSAMRNYKDESAYFVIQFFVDAKVVVVDAKSDTLSAVPAIATTKGSYCYPFRVGLRVLAIDPDDNKRYSGQIMGIFDCEDAATAEKDLLDRMRLATEASTSKALSSTSNKRKSAETSTQVLAKHVDRSPRVDSMLDDVVRSDSPEGREDAGAFPDSRSFSEERDSQDQSRIVNLESEAEHSESASVSGIFAASKGEEKLVRPGLNGMQQNKVLLFPYEISKYEITRPLLVPSFSPARLYVDQAVLTFLGKAENRPTKGGVVADLMDSLLGGVPADSDGMQKLRRMYAEKRATWVSKRPMGMIHVMPITFVKCVKLYLDQLGYTTKTGDWVSRAMNRWKIRRVDGGEDDANDN